jgi:hypothetical protein
VAVQYVFNHAHHVEEADPFAAERLNRRLVRGVERGPGRPPIVAALRPNQQRREPALRPRLKLHPLKSRKV